MKKTASFVLAAAMVLAMAFMSFAADPNTQTEVSYTPASESYTFTIPATAEITAADTAATLTVSGSDVKILKSSKLQFKVTSTNSWKMKNGTSEIGYTAKVGETTLANDSEVFSIAGVGTQTAATQGLTKDISIVATTAQINNATAAGKHTDTLTFTVAIVAAN